MTKATILPFFLFCLFTSIYFLSTGGGVNSGDQAVYALTKAIVEKNSVAIDAYKKWTYDVDYALINNHYYLDREPGLSFLAAPFYIVGKITSRFASPPYRGFNRYMDTESSLQALTYMTTAFFGGLTVSVYYLLSRHLGSSHKSVFFSSCICGGTLSHVAL